MKKNKGFTLIELLVVIAIIGILSSVVLASLNTARDKGAVAAGKSNLINTRPQAELFYDANSNSYDGGTAATDVCNSAGLVGTVKGINAGVLAAAKANLSTAVVVVDQAAATTAANATCNSGASAWAAEVMLKGGTFYCVDSTGNATTPASAGLTAAADYTC